MILRGKKENWNWIKTFMLCILNIYLIKNVKNADNNKNHIKLNQNRKSEEERNKKSVIRKENRRKQKKRTYKEHI